MGSSGSKKALSPELTEKVVAIYQKIDIDGSNTIDKEETLKYWKGNFAKVQTEELFKACDIDGNGKIDLEEWLDFWRTVRGAGNSEDDIMEELEELEKGKAWVKFNNMPNKK